MRLPPSPFEKFGRDVADAIGLIADRTPVGSVSIESAKDPNGREVLTIEWDELTLDADGERMWSDDESGWIRHRRHKAYRLIVSLIGGSGARLHAKDQEKPA